MWCRLHVGDNKNWSEIERMSDLSDWKWLVGIFVDEIVFTSSISVVTKFKFLLLASTPSLKLNSAEISLGLHFILHIPIFLLSFSNNSCFKGFVNRSAICSSLRQKLSSIMPSLHKSLKKWNRTSMCLLLPWNTRFLDNLIVDILSQNITVVPGCFWLRISSIFLNQIAWHEHAAAATNSASVVESVTIGCFFEDQQIAPELIMKILPEVLLRSSISPA